jgi:hypothetical protein
LKNGRTSSSASHAAGSLLRKRVNWNDSAIGTGVVMGTLPAGAMIVSQNVRCNTAFNAARPTRSTSARRPAERSCSPTPRPRAPVQPTIANLSFASDTDIYVQYAQTGTAATAGQADIVIGYVPNNDL